MMQATTQSRIC